MSVGKVAALLGAALLTCAAVGSAALAGAPARPPPPLAKNYASSWEQYQDYLKAANGGTKMTWDKLPDWSGIWTHTGGFAVDSSMPRDQVPNMLTPEYRAKYLKKLDEVSKGIEWDPLSYCLPAGYPRWLLEPFLREFILRPEQAWLVNEMQVEVRRVYADGRAHPPEDEAYPKWEGDSVGFWDGDTLVVHTKNVRSGMWQRLEPDHSDQLSTVERWRKVDANTIEAIVTVYDPVSLVRPWHIRHAYTRVTDPPGLRIDHWSCSENNNVVKTDEGSSQFILPGEEGYKDPNNLGPATR